MDGITSKNMARYQRHRILDNAVLVVDEVHNITNASPKIRKQVFVLWS